MRHKVEELAGLFFPADLARLRALRHGAQHPRRQRSEPAARVLAAPDPPRARILRHRDGAGRVWAFGFICSEHQISMFRQLLADVSRRLSIADKLSLSAQFDDSSAPGFFGAVESAILQGLADAFPADIPAPVLVEALQDHQDPAKIEPAQAEPAQAPAVLTAAGEPARGDWWEDM